MKRIKKMIAMLLAVAIVSVSLPGISCDTTVEAVGVEAVLKVLGFVGPIAKKIISEAAESMLQDVVDENGNEAASVLLNIARWKYEENIAEILDIVEDLDQDVARLESELLNGFKELEEDLYYDEMSGYINELQAINDAIAKSWVYYEDALEVAVNQSKTDGGTISVDSDEYKALILELKELDDEGCFDKYFLTMNTILTQEAGESTLYTTVYELAKLQYPFENQTTDTMIATYQCATALQVQVLTLYRELAAYYGTDAAITEYNYYVEYVGNSIEAQCDWLDLENSSHLDIVGNDGEKIVDDDGNEIEGLKDNVNTTVENGAGTFEAYKVVSNYTGETYYVLKDLMTLEPMVEVDTSGISTYFFSDYYWDIHTTLDGNYAIANNAQELTGLLGGALGSEDYVTWLISTGGLDDLSGIPETIIIHNSASLNTNSAVQYLMQGTSSTLTSAYVSSDDYYRIEMKDIYKGNNVSIDNKTVNAADITTLIVYKDKTTADEVLTPKTQAELEVITTLTDGQTLDLSRFPGTELDMGAEGHTITFSGNVTIIGDVDKTITGIRFMKLDNDIDTTLTIENLNIVAPDPLLKTEYNVDEYPYESYSAIDFYSDGNLQVVGSCSIDIDYTTITSTSYDVLGYVYGIGVRDAELNIYGEGTLDVKGATGIFVDKNSTLHITNLTVNAVGINDVREVAIPEGFGGATIVELSIRGSAIGASGVELDAGTIIIDGGATVSASVETYNTDTRLEDIGTMVRSNITDGTDFSYGTVAGGYVENATLNLAEGSMNENIEIRDNVIFTGNSTYIVDVSTMDFTNADSPNDIYLIITGNNGKTITVNMSETIDTYNENKLHNALDKGSEENFYVYGTFLDGIESITLYNSHTVNEWYGAYMTIAALEENFESNNVFSIYQWIDENKTVIQNNNIAHKVTLTMAADSGAGSNGDIYASLLGEDGELIGTSIATWDYISGNAYQKGDSDVFYCNFNTNSTNFDIDDVKGITVKLDGNDAAHISKVVVEAIQGETVVATNSVYVDQWLNDETVWNHFYFEAEDSVQYRVEVTTSSKMSSETNSDIYMAIGEDKSSMTDEVWFSNNASYNMLKKGATDSYNICYTDVIDEIKELALRNDGNNAWTVEKVTIYRIHNGQQVSDEYVFELDNLSFEDKDGTQWLTYDSINEMPEVYSKTMTSNQGVYILQEQLLALAESDETLTVNRTDEYGTILYTWEIDGADLEEENITEDFDTTITLIDGDDAQLYEDNLVGFCGVFGHTGSLASEMTLHVTKTGDLLHEDFSLYEWYLTYLEGERVYNLIDDSVVQGKTVGNNVVFENLEITEDSVSFVLSDVDDFAITGEIATPETGDYSNIMLYLSMMGLAIGMMMYLGINKRKISANKRK